MANKRQRKKRGKQTLKQQFPQAHFRLTHKIVDEYKKAVKNTQGKIRNVFKNHLIDLRDEIPIPKLEDFKSKAHYNAWMKKSESFRSRSNREFQFIKNKHNISVSKKAYDEMQKYTNKAQEKYDERINRMKDKPFISGGKVQGTVGQQRFSVLKNTTGGRQGSRPSDFNFGDIKSLRMFEERLANMKKRTDEKHYNDLAELRKQNFREIVSLSFHSLADELVARLDDLPSDVFYDMYDQFDEFDFNLFDSEGQMVEADEGTIARLMQYMDMYERGEIDFDLKGFPNR